MIAESRSYSSSSAHAAPYRGRSADPRLPPTAPADRPQFDLRGARDRTARGSRDHCWGMPGQGHARSRGDPRIPRFPGHPLFARFPGRFPGHPLIRGDSRGRFPRGRFPGHPLFPIPGTPTGAIPGTPTIPAIPGTPTIPDSRDTHYWGRFLGRFPGHPLFDSPVIPGTPTIRGGILARARREARSGDSGTGFPGHPLFGARLSRAHPGTGINPAIPGTPTIWRPPIPRPSRDRHESGMNPAHIAGAGFRHRDPGPGQSRREVPD